MLKKITLDKVLNKLTNQRVFLRTDFNVPMKNGKIVDDFRIQSSFSSMNKILQQKPKSLIIATHLGRPNGQFNNQYTLKPIYEYLQQNFNSDIKFIEYPLDQDKVDKLKNEKGIFLLENLRFNPEEEGKVKKPDGSKEKVSKEEIQSFRNKLTQISDIYVNDAFGTMHRAHSSIVGVDVQHKVAGDLVKDELQNFGKILEHPEDLGILLGGAKVSDKIPVIKHLLEKSQNIMIGGAMAFTFLKVKDDIDIGDSLFEEESRQKVEDILNLAEKKRAKIHLPLDFVAGKDLKNEDQNTKTFNCGDDVGNDWKGFDIGPKTVKEYTEVIKECKQLVWNGPMGVFENKLYSKGSLDLAKQIASRTQSNKLISIIGGGDTANLVEKAKLKNQFTHVSTGGGASLELMAGEDLPGVKFLSSEQFIYQNQLNINNSFYLLQQNLFKFLTFLLVQIMFLYYLFNNKLWIFIRFYQYLFYFSIQFYTYFKCFLLFFRFLRYIRIFKICFRFKSTFFHFIFLLYFYFLIYFYLFQFLLQFQKICMLQILQIIIHQFPSLLLLQSFVKNLSFKIFQQLLRRTS